MSPKSRVRPKGSLTVRRVADGKALRATGVTRRRPTLPHLGQGGSFPHRHLQMMTCAIPSSGDEQIQIGSVSVAFAIPCGAGETVAHGP